MSNPLLDRILKLYLKWRPKKRPMKLRRRMICRISCFLSGTKLSLKPKIGDSVYLKNFYFRNLILV